MHLCRYEIYVIRRKFTNNNDVCPILGRRKMTQKHKKETQKTQNQ